MLNPKIALKEKMGLLAVDIGNTSTTLGLFDAEGVLAQRFDIPTRTLTHRALTREALDAPLADILLPNTIAIASVVPWASDELIAVLQEMFPSANLLVITSSNIPLQIDYPRPEELGTEPFAWRACCLEVARRTGATALHRHRSWNGNNLRCDYFGWRFF